MVQEWCLLELFSVIWCEELVPRQWREGLIVNLDKRDPGNYRGNMLLSVVGKVLERGGILHEGLRVNRSCMDDLCSR